MALAAHREKKLKWRWQEEASYTGARSCWGAGPQIKHHQGEPKRFDSLSTLSSSRETLGNLPAELRVVYEWWCHFPREVIGGRWCFSYTFFSNITCSRHKLPWRFYPCEKWTTASTLQFVSSWKQHTSQIIFAIRRTCSVLGFFLWNRRCDPGSGHRRHWTSHFRCKRHFTGVRMWDAQVLLMQPGCEPANSLQRVLMEVQPFTWRRRDMSTSGTNSRIPLLVFFIFNLFPIFLDLFYLLYIYLFLHKYTTSNSLYV